MRIIFCSGKFASFLQISMNFLPPMYAFLCLLLSSKVAVPSSGRPCAARLEGCLSVSRSERLAIRLRLGVQRAPSYSTPAGGGGGRPEIHGVSFPDLPHMVPMGGRGVPGSSCPPPRSFARTSSPPTSTSAGAPPKAPQPYFEGPLFPPKIDSFPIGIPPDSQPLIKDARSTPRMVIPPNPPPAVDPKSGCVPKDLYSGEATVQPAVGRPHPLGPRRLSLWDVS